MPKEKADGGAYRELKKAVAENALGRLYVFYGEEDYLRDYYLGEMRKKLVPPGLEEFNFHRFAGKNLTLSQLSAAVDTFPVLSERTLITVSDYDLYKSGEKDTLTALLSDLPEYCCLVFVYDTIEYSPDARTKLHAVLKKQGSAVRFDRQDQSDLVGWVRRRFRALGKEIDATQAEYLIFRCGSLMTGLISEIEKVGAYAKETKITREEIDAVAVPVLDAVVFQMTDAMAEGDFDNAAEILARLLKMQEAPIRLLAAVGRQMRQLYSARLVLDSGGGTGELAALWGMRSSYPAQLLLRSARHFSAVWCRRAVRLCAEADMSMKSSGQDGGELMKLLLVRLGQEAGR